MGTDSGADIRDVRPQVNEARCRWRRISLSLDAAEDAMDYLLLGRVAKLAALLGFVLPWVTVSCSGTEILTATGDP